MKVRVAFGTGAVLGLWHGRVETAPTTAHLLTYHQGRCRANCKFCPQASGSISDLKMLSRVVWPTCELERVLQGFSTNPRKFQRICVQGVNYPNSINDICNLVERVKEASPTPVSVSSHPPTYEEMHRLKSAGIERLCIPVDACTAEIFSEIKEGHEWENHLRALEEAQEIFATATTHLIIGLGETEEQAAKAIQMFTDRGVSVGLFALTPVRGTPLESRKPPEMGRYRRVQLAHHVIREKLATVEQMGFKSTRLVDFGVSRRALENLVNSGDPFRTSGCPSCNRPFYNESPRGPIYNYPRSPTTREIEEIKKAFI